MITSLRMVTAAHRSINWPLANSRLGGSGRSIANRSLIIRGYSRFTDVVQFSSFAGSDSVRSVSQRFSVCLDKDFEVVLNSSRKK